jgi:hypothetical protein
MGGSEKHVDMQMRSGRHLKNLNWCLSRGEQAGVFKAPPQHPGLLTACPGPASHCWAAQLCKASLDQQPSDTARSVPQHGLRDGRDFANTMVWQPGAWVGIAVGEAKGARFVTTRCLL